jgi:hypothetical protein
MDTGVVTLLISYEKLPPRCTAGRSRVGRNTNGKRPCCPRSGPPKLVSRTCAGGPHPIKLNPVWGGSTFADPEMEVIADL